MGVKSPMEWDAPGKGGMIGSGPFQFVGFQKDVDCYVRANKAHWTGGPKIDGLHYIQASGIEQLVGGMEAGNIHIVGDGLTLPDGKRLAQREEIDLIQTHSGTIVNFWLDNRRPPFNDKAFRHAMYYALPKKKIIDIALGGAGHPARRSPIPPVFEIVDSEGPAGRRVRSRQGAQDPGRQRLQDRGRKADHEVTCSEPDQGCAARCLRIKRRIECADTSFAACFRTCFCCGC